jgi:hypothetical protein
MSELKNSNGPPQPQGVGEDPLLHFTKVFVRFLQLVFSTFDKGSYKWEPDQENSDILVSDQGVLRADVLEKRPAIVCMRGPAAWSNISMDQFKDYDFETGAKSHTDLVAATMVYNCLAREGLEAQRIAWIAGYATRTLKRNLLRAGMHRVGEDISYSAETDAGSLLPDSGKDFSLVSVTVPFFFQDSYRISPVDKLLLKELDLILTSEVNGTTPAEQPALREPAIGGRVLKDTKVISLTQRVATLVPRPRKLRK